LKTRFHAARQLANVDPDTGHRVIRLTREPGSDSFYFNVNGYTPDGKKMAYSTPKAFRC
jgi:Tol biopolymer transport system component